MSNLIDPIEGYVIVLMKNTEPGLFTQAPVIPLQLSRVGGAHVVEPEQLIKKLEDAVFKNEQSSNSD